MARRIGASFAAEEAMTMKAVLCALVLVTAGVGPASADLACARSAERAGVCDQVCGKVCKVPGICDALCAVMC
ncbi:hypothetical protein [Allokutzneria albata]|uniref:Uncharacterized protein n=1 Tax=Allokutzneria albata TaxID=211114 RepID=A0A1G9X593_ALLAB|nr:hypothetical protein [Allokutzneria albata]SDM91535.1 hypothetical protein SAMN04489726_3979 [Allokutzneria albata]